MPLLPSVTWSSGSTILEATILEATILEATILEATILEAMEFVARGRIPVARL